MTTEVTDNDRVVANAEADAIAKRWVPDHMTARRGMVDDIAASLINARRLERDSASAEVDRLKGELAKYKDEAAAACAEAACERSANTASGVQIEELRACLTEAERLVLEVADCEPVSPPCHRRLVSFVHRQRNPSPPSETPRKVDFDVALAQATDALKVLGTGKFSKPPSETAQDFATRTWESVEKHRAEVESMPQWKRESLRADMGAPSETARKTCLVDCNGFHGEDCAKPGVTPFGDSLNETPAFPLDEMRERMDLLEKALKVEIGINAKLEARVTKLSGEVHLLDAKLNPPTLAELQRFVYPENAPAATTSAPQPASTAETLPLGHAFVRGYNERCATEVNGKRCDRSSADHAPQPAKEERCAPHAFVKGPLDDYCEWRTTLPRLSGTPCKLPRNHHIHITTPDTKETP